MAALIRGFSQLNRTSLTVSSGLIRRTHNSTAIKNDVQDDLPIELENPFGKERRLCILCKHNIEPDYKNVRLLSQFQSVYTGRIYGKHITGLCDAKQKKLENEILKAQNAGMMGYYEKDVKYVSDPKLFDPNNPFRPHKF